MAYKSLADCVVDLEKHAQLIRISEEVDPYLEMAAIHRRVYQAGGPALFFERVKGSPFPAVSNLFGTLERSRFIFRDTLEAVKNLVRFKSNPAAFLRKPTQAVRVPWTALTSLPMPAWRAPVLKHQTTLSELPQIVSWMGDGGPFILLPQVYTEHPDHPSVFNSNLGMYRIQLAGNQYEQNREAGLHYQIRRDIGIHHAAALRRGEPLRVSVFVGGPPAHAFASVMYLPEGLSELLFAGALAGRGFRYRRQHGNLISADADFCITGTVMPGQMKPEGPFGDHLGYYSMKHDFPVLRVEHVYHRRNAIWPFTVVGRPPQEDSQFGKLIQEIAGPMIPKEIPGIKAVHAVDAAGVHPLLLAIGSERYTPYGQRKPQEILTLANALLGYGPCSLAKFLWIVAEEDNPTLDIHNVADFFRHVLERVDWKKDLHFQTATTMDTLDYSGTGLNEGSKVVIAAAGEKRRALGTRLPDTFRLPEGFAAPKIVLPGVIALSALPFVHYKSASEEIRKLAAVCEENENLDAFPLIVLTEDSDFCAASLHNFLWVTFTRTNPSHDLDGVRPFQEFKHWGCHGSLILDARLKPHHAPPVMEDAALLKKIQRLGLEGQPLHGFI